MITRRTALLTGTALSLLPGCKMPSDSIETSSLKRFPDQFLWERPSLDTKLKETM